eukprot:TRINITY_DN65448_c0_g1_i1.p1 TRINITY_DN65448_c0_g1~~TRINITY_DN65448_c0_g1_i1.p1  ORF type:complete len:664 (-),score=93.59 TRINITY_DN65448_c0_g1_i1:175-2166(-)
MGAILSSDGNKRSLHPESEQNNSPASKRRRTNNIVKLNVGGMRFTASRESLVKCAYFRTLFDGGFATPDEDDELFVDRDGQVFHHMLNYMRTNRRPSEVILKQYKRELIAEAEFFGFDALLCVLRGSTDPFQLLPRDRQMLPDEEECAEFFSSNFLSEDELRVWEAQMLLDVFADPASFAPREPRDLQLPLLQPHSGPRPTFSCADLEAFRTHLSRQLEPEPGESDVDSDGADIRVRRSEGQLLADLESIGGLVIAGGSVLAALTDGKACDVDIFVCGDADTAEQRLREVLLALKRNGRRRYPSLSSKMKLVRTRLAVTAQRCEGAPVQIILSVFRSPLEVILNFDLDSCCFLYDLSRKVVRCLPRAQRALAYRTNIANTDMRSPTYERRLEKYAKRGYSIAVPGFEEDAIDQSLLAGSFAFHKEADLLLKVGQRSTEVKEVCREHTWSHTKLLAGEHQQLDVVGGFCRLLVLDRLRRDLVHNAGSVLEDGMLLANGGSDQPIGKLELVRALAYQRFTQGGGPEVLEDSDAHRAIRVIQSLADCSDRLVPRESFFGEDQGLSQTPERKQPGWMSRSAWRKWAKARCESGQSVWFVPDATAYRTDDLNDAELLFDTGSSFDRGVPQVLKFERANESSCPFAGRQGHAEYHVARGSWFVGVYSAE